MSAGFATFSELVRTRRTVKAFTGQAIERPLLETLLELGTWAPTHRMHQPWRFAVLDQAAIARLAAFLQASPQIANWPDATKGPAKLAKLLDRLPTLGALVQVSWVRHADPAIDTEDHEAAAAAVQNILLGVHAAGLGGFWSTSAALRHPDTLRWCLINPNQEQFIGSLWLGHAVAQPPAPPRKSVTEVSRWL